MTNTTTQPKSGSFRLAVVVLALCTALAGCATYRKCGFGGCPGDAAMLASVKAAFAEHPSLGPPTEITIKVVDHVVYLYGQVNTDFDRRMAEDVAYKVEGVNKVVNSISLNYP